MQKNQSQKIPLRRFLQDHADLILLAFFFAVGLRVIVFSVYRIPNAVMAPTLQSGDFVFGFRLPFGIRVPILGTQISTGHLPERGDVVAFGIRNDALETSVSIKRVIGIPGDQIEIVNGRVRLNGEWLKISESSAPSGVEVPSDRRYQIESIGAVQHGLFVPRQSNPVRIADNQSPVVVPPGSLYVLGDDRVLSDDSRQFGPIGVKQVESRIWITWLSLVWNDNKSPTLRWERVLRSVE